MSTEDQTPTPGVNTPVPPQEYSALPSPDAHNSALVSIADLCAKGASFYTQGDFPSATDMYARASELQAELNGEMDPENAEVLFLYGRALFRVGQGKSDVLGGGVGGEAKAKTKKGKKVPETVKEEEENEQEVKEEGVAIIAEHKQNSNDAKAADTTDAPEANKPLFQFTGDENFDDSDAEDEGDAEGEEEEEEEEADDLADAFEVLDLARVLFTRRLEQLPAPASSEGSKGKEPEQPDTAMETHVKERLADTHDLLAEISLESEKFPEAVKDFKESLRWKQELYPQASGIIAEAHYKLSLALEFSSITTTKEEEGAEGEAKEAEKATVDEAMREEAAKEMESAIESTKLKLQEKEIELAEMADPAENDDSRKDIAETKEIIAEMELRVSDYLTHLTSSSIINH
jgi:hypothetical protein